ERGGGCVGGEGGGRGVELEKGGEARCARISFQAAADTDVNDLRRGLEVEGVRCELRADPSPGIAQVITFADPKGTIVEVFTAATPLARKPVSGLGPIRHAPLAF